MSEIDYNFKLIVSCIKSNGDGSYIVTFGYDNPNSNIFFDEGDYGLRVLKGRTIILKRLNSNILKHGSHFDELVAVVNYDSEIEFYFGNKSIIIKGSEIIDKFVN